MTEETNAINRNPKPETENTAFFRRHYAYLLLLGTVLVVLSGLVLPEAVLRRVQDSAMAGVNTAELGTAVSPDMMGAYETKELSLETTTRLVKGGIYDEDFHVYYHEPEPGSMEEPEAVSRLRQEIARLTEAGLLPEGSDDFSGAQYTAILAGYGMKQGEDRDAYDVWDISVYRQEMSLDAGLHAESGKVLSVVVSVYNAPEQETGTESVPAFLERFQASDAACAFADYLGFSDYISSVEKQEQDDTFVSCILKNGLIVDCYYWFDDDGSLYLSYDLSA